MRLDEINLRLKIAEHSDELKAAQRLRYRVFVEEMGAQASDNNVLARLECDEFDETSDHLLLIDDAYIGDPLDRVMGVYRLLSNGSKGFYGEDEFDISPLKETGKKLLELGRSCVDITHRNGIALHLLWKGLADYVEKNNIDIVFGTASFSGCDYSKHRDSISYLRHFSSAPAELQARSRDLGWETLNLPAKDDIDKKRAMREMPPMIKAYMRLGGMVGNGIFVDHAFNTIDVLVILETDKLSERYLDRYMR